MKKTGYYTIGMAGHIDHGKTTLTKALTHVDTDRLKEEKERKISIELGYAPLELEGLHVSVIDVPGHERFIRQMIAGVAGIDLVVLVIAADEGVMPQTREHMEILQLLGIEHGIIALTKVDLVENDLLELAEEDIRAACAGTIFEHAPLIHIDSLAGKGIEQLKERIHAELLTVEVRESSGTFRLPIDQAFTLKGQGVIARGTVYEGSVHKGDELVILPGGKKAKVRQLQVHHKEAEKAGAGMRAALNLAGIRRDDIRRGDVLVHSSDLFPVTKTIDVVLTLPEDPRAPLKQRAPVNVYTATSVISGKIVYFDRNTIDKAEKKVLCQIRLDEPIVIKRGDRFILRRPTPVETLGGGWVIDPYGEKYRFGEETVTMLERKKKGTPLERVVELLERHKLLTKQEIMQAASCDEQELNDTVAKGMSDGILCKLPKDRLVLTKTVNNVKEQAAEKLGQYHASHPLLEGQPKAELVQILSRQFSKDLIEYCLDELVKTCVLHQSEQFIAFASFQPHIPDEQAGKAAFLMESVKDAWLAPEPWAHYAQSAGLNETEGEALKAYLLRSGQIREMTDSLFVASDVFEQALDRLKKGTGKRFSLPEAKGILGVSRKFLIPFLEKLDELQLTIRADNEREWINQKANVEDPV